MTRTRTEGETRQEAYALEDIARLIVKYFPPDSGISHREVVAKVICILETKSGPVFERLFGSFPRGSSGSGSAPHKKVA